MQLKNYPIDGHSFGWDSNGWKRLIKDNVSEFKSFFDTLMKNDDPIKAQETIIKEYKENTDIWSDLVKNKSLLGSSDNKNIYLNDNIGIVLYNRQWAEPLSANNVLLKENLEKSKLGWDINLYRQWPSCVYIENKNKDIVFDIWYWKVDGNENWEIDFFKRDGEEVKSNLKKYIDESKDTWSFNTDNNRYHTTIKFDKDKNKDFSDVSSFLEEIIDIIEKVNQ